MPDHEPRIDTRSVFREPRYVRFWFARICSTISFQMAAVAVGWQVYALTHSTFALGMVGTGAVFAHGPAHAGGGTGGRPVQSQDHHQHLPGS